MSDFSRGRGERSGTYLVAPTSSLEGLEGEQLEIYLLLHQVLQDGNPLGNPTLEGHTLEVEAYWRRYWEGDLEGIRVGRGLEERVVLAKSMIDSVMSHFGWDEASDPGREKRELWRKFCIVARLPTPPEIYGHLQNVDSLT